jgi:hypothetical protein
MLTRTIDEITIHCTATPNGKVCFTSVINDWHRDRGFRRRLDFRRRLNFRFDAIGYHGIIHHAGHYASGRHFDEWGAHVQGSNANSIGFAMVGMDKFSSGQWIGLRSTIIQTIAYIADQSGVYVDIESGEAAVEVAEDLGIVVQGHRDHSPDLNGDGQISPWEWVKTCPGFDAGAWFRSGMKTAPEGALL